MRFPVITAALLAMSVGACCPAKTVAPTPEPTPEPAVPAVETPEPATPTVEVPEPAIPNVEVPEPATPVTADTGARHSVSLLGTRTLEVAVGDIITFSFEQHGSVGRHASWSIESDRIVAFVRQDTIFKNPERMDQGMTGADAATGTFVFKAIAPGTTNLELATLFRGQTENSATITVTVR